MSLSELIKDVYELEIEEFYPIHAYFQQLFIPFVVGTDGDPQFPLMDLEILVVVYLDHFWADSYLSNGK